MSRGWGCPAATDMRRRSQYFQMGLEDQRSVLAKKFRLSDRFNFSFRLWTFFLSSLLNSKLTVCDNATNDMWIFEKLRKCGKAPAWWECCPCKTPLTMCPTPQSRRQMPPEIFSMQSKGILNIPILLNGKKIQYLEMSYSPWPVDRRDLESWVFHSRKQKSSKQAPAWKKSSILLSGTSLNKARNRSTRFNIPWHHKMPK